MNSSNSSKKRGPDALKMSVTNDNAILCDLCQTWVRINCKHLYYIDYKYLQRCNDPWYCLFCTTMIFPFGNLNNQKFLGFINNNNSNDNNNNNNNNKE